jgi:hypothetical protein
MSTAVYSYLPTGTVYLPPTPQDPAQVARQQQSLDIENQLIAWAAANRPDYLVTVNRGDASTLTSFETQYPVDPSAFGLVLKSQAPGATDPNTSKIVLPFSSATQNAGLAGLFGNIITSIVTLGGGLEFLAPEVAAGAVPTESGEVGSLSSSESLGTSTTNLQVARLGIADYAGTTPQAIEIAGATPSGAALDLPALQLGASTSQLFAADTGVLTQATALSKSLGTGLGESETVQRILNAIEHGNVSDVFNTLLGVVGIPPVIPGGTTPGGPGQPGQPIAQAGGGFLSGGGAANPSYVTDPAAVNLPMYVIGIGLFVVLGLLMFRGKG